MQRHGIIGSTISKHYQVAIQGALLNDFFDKQRELVEVHVHVNKCQG
jgi:hypothetical protein